VEEELVQGNPTKDIHFKAPHPTPIQPYYNKDELKKFLAVGEKIKRLEGGSFTAIIKLV
jgi:hypothetical protein